MTMQAGRLRHWLTFEAPAVDLDSDGAQVVTWGDAFAVNSRMPCEVTQLSGRELIAAQAVQSKITARIRARYRPGFAADMRALGEGVVYNIEAVVADPNTGREWVTLLASAGVNDG